MDAGDDRGRDWSDLNPDLLKLIAGAITEISDQFRFRAVCRSWRTAGRYITPLHSGPWLLLVPYVNSQEQDCHIIHPFDGNRRYTLRTPYSVKMKSSHNVYGSQTGYFLLIDDVTRSASITNPLRAGYWFTIPPLLPPPRDLPTPDETKWHNAKIFRAGESNLNVVVSVGEEGIPYLWRLGDSTWTKMYEDQFHEDVRDFVLYKGSFYLVEFTTKTVVLDSTTLAKTSEIAHPEIDYDEDNFCLCYYLVESSSGQLLMVVWDLYYMVWVFQLDLSDQQPKWVRIRSIGDATLFLCYDGAMCYSNRLGVFDKNSVCFFPIFIEGDELVIFDIEDDSLMFLPWVTRGRRPVWLMPK